jgi:hypothetical protein
MWQQKIKSGHKGILVTLWLGKKLMPGYGRAPLYMLKAFSGGRSGHSIAGELTLGRHGGWTLLKG